MGTWGPGPLENDAALDFVGDRVGALVATIDEFLDAPDLTSRFARAFAALALLELYAKHTATGLPVPAEIERWKQVFLSTFDREIAEYTQDTKFIKAQRKALDKLLVSLAAQSTEFHRGEAGTPSSALSRALQRMARMRRDRPFTVRYAELIELVAPYGEDIARLWTECQAGDQLLAIGEALRVPHSKLHAIVVEAVQPALARLPADAPAATDAAALERWATAAVASPGRDKLPLAAIARAAAHVARALAEPEHEHLGLAVKELLDGAALDASVAAAKTGMSWMDAMTDTSGPGWTAWHTANAELGKLVHARLPVPELTRRV